jgi:hypothetical protein
MGAGASKADILQSMGQIESTAVELPPTPLPTKALIASVIAKAKGSRAAPVAVTPVATTSDAPPSAAAAVAVKSEE